MLTIQICDGTIVGKPLLGVHGKNRDAIPTSMAATFLSLPV